MYSHVLPPAKGKGKWKKPRKNKELCKSEFADWVFVTVRDQILPRSPDRTPSVISDFPHGTSQHVLVLTWARHSFLVLSYLIFFIILIRTPLRHQLRFPLFPFRTSLCFLYVHVVYPSPTVTIDSIRTLLPFSISSYPTCTVAS